MTEKPTVLIGTTKGAFLADGDDGWAVSGPFCDGWTINHVIGDRETGRVWAAGGGQWEGAGIWRRDPGGDWRVAKLANGARNDFIANNPDEAAALGFTPEPEAPFTGDIDSIWSLRRVGGRLFAGSRPAHLFVSDDDGATWARVDSLSDHPSRTEWNPGAAGMTLHTIVHDPADPAKIWLGVSAAGVFASEDGGETWERRNRLCNAPAEVNHPAGPRNGETGWCVHNMVRAPGRGDLLYQQNHHGAYRSADGGRSWDDITPGLPSTFGFPIGVHPRDPETIWTLPLNGDSAGRYPPGAAAAVWKSTDGGRSWTDRRAGLPQQACYFTVLRQAMAVDRADPAGVYFATNTGSVFASFDEGENWEEIARHLPTVLSVEVM